MIVNANKEPNVLRVYVKGDLGHLSNWIKTRISVLNDTEDEAKCHTPVSSEIRRSGVVKLDIFADKAIEEQTGVTGVLYTVVWDARGTQTSAPVRISRATGAMLPPEKPKQGYWKDSVDMARKELNTVHQFVKWLGPAQLRADEQHDNLEALESILQEFRDWTARLPLRWISELLNAKSFKTPEEESRPQSQGGCMLHGSVAALTERVKELQLAASLVEAVADKPKATMVEDAIALAVADSAQPVAEVKLGKRARKKAKVNEEVARELAAAIARTRAKDAEFEKSKAEAKAIRDAVDNANSPEALAEEQATVARVNAMLGDGSDTAAEDDASQDIIDEQCVVQVEARDERLQTEVSEPAIPASLVQDAQAMLAAPLAAALLAPDTQSDAEPIVILDDQVVVHESPAAEGG